MKKLFVLSLALLLFSASCGTTSSGADEVEFMQQKEVEIEPNRSVPLDFLDSFTEYGYTAEQTEAMRTILVNVGVTEITELEVEPVVYGMQTLCGKVGNEYMKDIDVQINIENGVVYLVTIFCSNIWTALDGLVDERADLYYDVNGGYLKKIDWESKSVVDY